MEAQTGVARREPDASRALRQAIGEHEMTDAAAQGPVESAAAEDKATTISDARRDASSTAEAGESTADTGSLPGESETNVYARSFRPSVEHLESRVKVAEPVDAGDVLVIDPEGSGAMSLARIAADSAVFGIVAAEPGGVASEGAIAVALSGIVLCKVDAGFGSIRAGDLLTTSPTHGHAMRAQDPRPGTILGKALEPLGSGTGRIQVLLTLD
jgi:hypothetical protein